MASCARFRSIATTPRLRISKTLDQSWPREASSELAPRSGLGLPEPLTIDGGEPQFRSAAARLEHELESCSTVLVGSRDALAVRQVLDRRGGGFDNPSQPRDHSRQRFTNADFAPITEQQH